MMPRKPRPACRLFAVLAVELAGLAAILSAVAMVWLPAALVLAGIVAIAVAQHPEELL